MEISELISTIEQIHNGSLKPTPELIIKIENTIQLLLYKPYNHSDTGASPAEQSGISDVESLRDRGLEIFTGMNYTTPIAVVAERLENNATKREIALLMSGSMRKHAEKTLISKLEELVKDEGKLKKSFDDFMKSRKFNSDNT